MGPLGALAGNVLGGLIADIIVNNQLGSSFKMNLIRGLTDDPIILQQAEKLLQETQDFQPLMLPPRGGTTQSTVGQKPIIVEPTGSGVGTQREYVGSELRVGNYQSSPNILPPTQ